MACLRERFGVEKEELESHSAPPPSLPPIPVEERNGEMEDEERNGEVEKKECASSANNSSRNSSHRERMYYSSSSSSSSSRPSLTYAKSLLQEFREYRYERES